MSTDVVSFDGLVLLPVLAPALGAVLLLLLDALVPSLARVMPWLGLAACLVGLVAAVGQGLATDPTRTRSLCRPLPDSRCFYDPSTTGSLLQAAALFGGAVVILLAWRAASGPAPDLLGGPTLVTTLVLTTVAGAATVAAALDAGTWLVGLELATLPVVALVALRGTGRASHGALSLLTTALLSVGLLVVGIALWVVATHDVTFTPAAAGRAWHDATTRPVLLLAVLFLVAGLGFKVSAVPFHTWTPVAYAGAGPAVATLLATVSKVAAVAGLVVVLRPVTATWSVGPAPHQLALVVGLLAGVTMTVGNVLALRQLDAVRLLAWSTIAQAGWVILPLTALRDSGLEASAGYVVAYVVATLLAFAVVAASGPTRLTAYRGMLRRHPLRGAALLLALVSLAGLPPGVLGLVAKILALRPVLGAGLWPLALVAVANAVVGVAVYLRWGALLFGAPDAEEPQPVAAAAGA
ncbi:proton-conducting transporter transmembrane domain-containing protein, partial [Nostocoides japonicum]|uniref:proton-conducting transporter transmembrane domain-containing protein n=1 Tax=Nostocoides japonicum TaxID=99481 RepID=UPI00069F6E52